MLCACPATDAQCPQICDANENTAVGDSALINNTGFADTAIGNSAMNSNTTGGENTATGGQALELNTTGNFNTATGDQALELNTTGNFNTATDWNALQGGESRQTGSNNTADGVNALQNNGAGSFNTAIGMLALAVGNGNGNNNIALGFEAGFNAPGNNNIDIGNLGVAGESNTIRIGGDVGLGYGTQTKTFIVGISGAGVTGAPVKVNSSGQLGVAPSSARFKEAIKPMDKTSEAILALKPVTFRYKKDIDPDGVPQFGLVAEQVEKVNPDLVARDEQGKPYTVRYEAVNAMLLNEFLKARRQIDAQRKQIEALTAVVQKVSAQLELSKPVSETIANNQ